MEHYAPIVVIYICNKTELNENYFPSICCTILLFTQTNHTSINHIYSANDYGKKTKPSTDNFLCARLDSYLGKINLKTIFYQALHSAIHI